MLIGGPRLLLVEDDQRLAELLRWHFEREAYEVRHTASGEEALVMAQESVPDVMILDWMLEELSGIEVLRRMRRMRHTAALPVIMLTARGEETDRVRGLETGADDYVVKPFSPRELIARVAAVLRRVRPSLSESSLAYADLEMDLIRHKVRRAGRTLALAPTEFRMLRIFLEHPGRVFSRERLLDLIWGEESETQERSVDVQIRRLRLALTAHGGCDLIRTVRAAGYALDSEA